MRREEALEVLSAMVLQVDGTYGLKIQGIVCARRSDQK
jgi:hypothetical protein